MSNRKSREAIQMKRWSGICALTFVCVFAIGCKKQMKDEDAIRASIEKRLTSRTDINLGVMDREVKQVSVNGDKATAQVEFRLKGGDAKMDIEYQLERQGGDWVVLSGQPMGAPPIMPPDAGQMPPGGPNSQDQQMPTGHPPTN
jgi:hypothetical protein